MNKFNSPQPPRCLSNAETTWWSSSQELRGRFVILAATAQVALRKEGREEAKVVSTECPSRGKTDGATRKSASDRTRAHVSPRFPLARSPAPWGCSARRSQAPSSVQWHCTRMSVQGSHGRETLHSRAMRSSSVFNKKQGVVHQLPQHPGETCRFAPACFFCY